MADLGVTYDSYWYDSLTGAVDSDTDTFYAMLLTASYTPDRGHDRRDDLTATETSGAGYTAGGQAVACTVTLDSGNHKVTVAFANLVVTTASITARYEAVYKRRGGASSADNLVRVIDNQSAATSTLGTFTFSETSPLSVNN